MMITLNISCMSQICEHFFLIYKFKLLLSSLITFIEHKREVQHRVSNYFLSFNVSYKKLRTILRKKWMKNCLKYKTNIVRNVDIS